MIAGRKNPVKELLKKKGVTQNQIARDLEVHPSHIGRVVSGKKKSLRVRLHICTRFNKSYEELWWWAA